MPETTMNLITSSITATRPNYLNIERNTASYHPKVLAEITFGSITFGLH